MAGTAATPPTARCSIGRPAPSGLCPNPRRAAPARVFPGPRLPGRMGAERRTVAHLEVVRVVPDQNLLLVKGAVPGATGGLVLVRKSVKLSKAQQKAGTAAQKG